MRKTTDNNVTPEFLLDGEEFFGAFGRCLDEVKASIESGSQAPANTYIRLAYWAMDPDTVIFCNQGDKRNPEYHTTIDKMLVELAKLGVCTGIILWDPDEKTSKNIDFAGKTKHFNTETHKRLHQREESSRNIYVHLEGHPGSGVTGSFGCALHQKIAVFSIAGKLKVLVGGFNMENEYWDTQGHDGSHPLFDKDNSLHDTAVLIQGPAAVHVEEEWLRRWKKKDKKLTFKNLDESIATLKKFSVKATSAVPQPTGASKITVLTTDPDSGEKDICKAIVEQINSATKYLYAENFQFFDPEIVDAACKRLRDRLVKFKVCVVVPDPVCDPERVNSYLNRVAYAKMGTAAADTDPKFTAFVTKAGTIDGFIPAWSSFKVEKPTFASNGWFEGESINIDTGDIEKTIKLDEVESFAYQNDAQPPKVQFYFPVCYRGDGSYANSAKIYVHSKLMIIDDKSLLVGSANFGYRSMNYDGEMSVLIEDGGFVGEVKTKLFHHWNVRALAEVPEAMWKDAKGHFTNCVKLVPKSPADLEVTYKLLDDALKKKMGVLKSLSSHTWI